MWRDLAMIVIMVEVAALLILVLGLAYLVYWTMTRNHPPAFPIRDMAAERRMEELEKRVLEAEKGVMVDSVTGARDGRNKRESGQETSRRDRGNHENH